MGLLGGKFLIFIVALILLAGVGIGQGLVVWQHDNYKCFGGTGFYSEVSKQRLITWGALHVYYQPYTWGCPTERRYDPSQYKIENGLLVPAQGL